MTSEDGKTTAPPAGGDLVVRSQVPPDKPYGAYKPWLRRDFFYSCAYCTMCEAEAQAIRFVIDHYEPVSARPDLKDIYDNLMYCCDECNLRKGDRCPTQSARENGFRFFRPDQDHSEEHVELNGLRLKPLSTVGEFSVEALDLNRALLRRLRDLRQRATRSCQLVAYGVRALRNYPIDRLPQHVKVTALKFIARAVDENGKFEAAIDEILRRYARSPLLEEDHDPETEVQKKERLKRLKNLQALFPGTWKASQRRT